MERVLQKMAGQLNSYDEASFIALWDKYATIVERFEPTKRWEEAAIVFCLIQAVRLKNQLFNHNLAAGLDVSRDGPLPGFNETKAMLERVKQGGAFPSKEGARDSEGGVGKSKPQKRCKVLRFSRRKSDKPV